MANTIDRSYPGDLLPGNGLTFRTSLNADRGILYAHTDKLQSALEVLSGALISDGTAADNTADLTIDSPTVGTVYCPTGYRAIIDGAPIITSATISQAYTPGALNYVFLAVGTDGDLSLRCSASATAGAGEILVATVSAVPAINNTPSGKPYARISLGDASDGSNVGILDAEFQAYTTDGTPGTETAVAHTLGRVPVGYIVVRKGAACDIYDGSTSWTSTNIYLKASTATAVTILIF